MQSKNKSGVQGPKHQTIARFCARVIHLKANKLVLPYISL